MGVAGTKRIRRLNQTEIDSYDVLPSDLAAKARVVRVPVLWGSYQGVALRRTILLRTDVEPNGGSRLLAHELVHVRQWADKGILGFLIAYVRDFFSGLVRTRSWDAAYRQIAIEVEARDVTEEWQRRRNLRPPPAA